MPGLLQLRANLAADISHVVSFREVKLDFELLLTGSGREVHPGG